MRTRQPWLKQIAKFGLLFLLGASMSACSTSWKEEVLLHDGQKIIVKRSQSRGGSHEFGQPPPIKEHTISFVLPNSNKTIAWTSEFGKDIGRSNFDLLAVHVLNGTPYIVATPNLCLSYNKWGRPNPPYVFFRYDGNAWQRISLLEFPVEFKTINVAANTLGDEDRLTNFGFVSAEKIKELNDEFKQPEYKTILREPIQDAGAGCGELIRVKDGWEGTGFFSGQPSKEACLKYCERNEVPTQNCPCNRFFKQSKGAGSQ